MSRLTELVHGRSGEKSAPSIGGGGAAGLVEKVDLWTKIYLPIGMCFRL